MDRNTFTGLFLILIILVGSTFLLKPSQEEIKQKAVQDSIAIAGNKNVAVVNNSKTVATQTTTDSSIVTKESFSVLENEKLKVTFSNLGAKVASVELKNQTSYLGKPLILFKNEDNKLGLSIPHHNGAINTEQIFFTKNELNGNTLDFSYTNADGSIIHNIYSLAPNSYQLAYTIELDGFQNKVQPNSSFTLNWETKLLQQEKDIKNERRYSGVFYKIFDGDVSSLSEAKDDEKVIEDEKAHWVSFKQHYFSSSILSKESFKNAKLTVKTLPDADTSALKIYKANLALPLKNAAKSTYQLQFIFAPNQYSVLKNENIGLENIIDLGWPPLKWVNKYGVMQLFSLLNKTGLSIGIIILILTIILKLVIFPFTYKSYVSMAKMRVLKPEMDEIKKRVGEDNQALVQQEYLKLYKKAGVNPLGGCLPLLFQMPFIIAFFYFFPGLFELRHQSFLWMHDLSTYDQIISFPTIPLLGWNHISLMCLLMTISTLIYTYFNNQVSGAQGQMKYIGYITPLIFFGVLNSYAAGLNLYYFFANVITFTQQYFIRQFVNDEKIHAQIQENKKKPEDTKKKGGFQKKLEDMMRQQEQIKQQQKKK